MPVPTSATQPPLTAQQFDPSLLADIHLPQAIGLWPIAPGWWILLALLLLLVILIILLSKEPKARKKQLSPKQLKSLALKELSIIENSYKADAAAHQSIKQLSIFLRRFALSHYHREQVASLTDEQWLALLDKMFDSNLKKQPFTNEFSELLTRVPYQSDTTPLDPDLIKQVFASTMILVKNYKKQDCKNV
ncbi:MAG: DUF4381 domain-containing protein [gamma proteobacterium symbiont of Taylorina sp.]|nr:DUF4381 domain-containing protein [gamma proteobacterium symbiont of Taylorina sp.]